MTMTPVTDKTDSVEEVSVKLGRFDHHPDPAIDFEIEVQSLEARLFDAKGGISKPGTPPETVAAVLVDIERAMTFRVGGDVSAVAAKQVLRGLETDARRSIANTAGEGGECVGCGKDALACECDDDEMVRDVEAYLRTHPAPQHNDVREVTIAASLLDAVIAAFPTVNHGPIDKGAYNRALRGLAALKKAGA